MEIRSFRPVFALERRIYRIDTLRLNPGGVPLRGIAYAAMLVVGSLALATVPPGSLLTPLCPWYVRDLAAPIGLASVLATVRIEGRAFHTAVGALLRHFCSPRTLRMLERDRRCASRLRPASIAFIADGSEVALRRMVYHGPGVVYVCAAHECVATKGRGRIAIHPSDHAGAARPTAIELRAGATLEVRNRPIGGRRGRE